MTRSGLSQNLRYVPLSYRFYRGAVLLIFVLALFLVWLGTTGRGPIKSLHSPTKTATVWVQKQMGVTEPVVKPAPTPAVQPTVKKNSDKRPKK